MPALIGWRCKAGPLTCRLDLPAWPCRSGPWPCWGGSGGFGGSAPPRRPASLPAAFELCPADFPCAAKLQSSDWQCKCQSCLYDASYASLVIPVLLLWPQLSTQHPQMQPVRSGQTKQYACDRDVMPEHHGSSMHQVERQWSDATCQQTDTQ